MDIIKKSTNIILKIRPDVIGIYLFGSAASESMTAESDIDLALLLPKKMDEMRRWKLQEKIAREIQRDVDLVDLLSASTVFSFQVVTNSKRIYCHDLLQCDAFEGLVYSKYIRFNEARQSIIDAIKKRGQIYD